jgi:hypothetical protein
MASVPFTMVVPDPKAAEFELLVKSIKANAELNHHTANNWDRLADMAAGFDPRLASLLRDHATSFRNLSIMGKTL